MIAIVNLVPLFLAIIEVLPRVIKSAKEVFDLAVELRDVFLKAGMKEDDSQVAAFLAQLEASHLEVKRATEEALTGNPGGGE